MARRAETRYVFDASAGTVKIPGKFDLSDLLLIVNHTDNVTLFNFADLTKTASVSYNSGTDSDFPTALDGITTVTLSYDTSSMSDTDSLAVYVEEQPHNGLRIRPYDFGTDAIERMRVANPQSLIDADFEYGLQNTKWQSVGLNANAPSFYETAGADLDVTAISSNGTGPYSTITVTVTSGAPAAGGVISITGTTNPLAEGLFIVLSSNGTTTFSYLAHGQVGSGTNSIYTNYSVGKKGGIFSGASLPLSSASSSDSIVTLGFSTNHGLIPGSPIYVADSRAGVQANEGTFFVKQVIDGTTFTYDAGATVSGVDSANLTVYAKTDAFFIHRPFDGGVRVGTLFPVLGLEAKRQSKRYFRYQSGKGILFSTGSLLSPVYDIDSATFDGTDVTITTSEVNGLQKGAVVKVEGITSANYDGQFTVNGINSFNQFTYRPTVNPSDSVADLTAFPRISGINWTGSAIRSGMFDDENGLFWEYDGNILYVVKRSSTQQIAGTLSVTNGSHTVTGTSTKFNSQLVVGTKLTIKGQTHIVTSINSDTSLTITPEYRGATASGIRSSLITELRVKQSEFNIDTIDGTGKSGFNVDISKMQMFGISYSWYGAGFVDFMIRGPRGEFITAHRMVNNNVNTEAYMRSGNLPARYEVSNYAANSYLTSASGTNPTTLSVADASAFPTPQAGYPNYVLVISNISGTTYQEVMEYTGISGNTLTGITPATSYPLFLAGSEKTFSGSSTSLNHPARSAVWLLNTSCSPTISHWGSAVVMDGGFDDDTGYLFNLARFNISLNANTTQTVLLFRAAPSVSNTIPGLLGERDVINRSIIKFDSIEVSTSRNIEIAAVLNPSNIGSGITWLNANNTSVGSANVYQPSFAQYEASTTTVPVDGEVLFRYIANSGDTRTFDLTKIKEVQNSIIGGDFTYPDGPELVCLVIANQNNQSASVDFSLKWTEAQA